MVAEVVEKIKDLGYAYRSDLRNRSTFLEREKVNLCKTISNQKTDKFKNYTYAGI